jgi:GNAT superfamily N-acetyltransferase
MTEQQIRKGKKEDLPQVLSLIKELAIYEKAPLEVTVTIEELENDSFGAQPIFSFFVAETDHKIVGTAIYFYKYSTWKGKCIFLEDIIVNDAFRGNQIGKKLLEAIILESRRLGAKRLEWQVLDWNEPAINFYKKFDVNFDASWLNCRLTEEQIKAYKIS